MGFKINQKGDFTYLTIPSFERTGLVHHCFTTRLGGVSRAPLNSMNLGLGRGDDLDAVMKNYQIVGENIGFDPARMVFFSQVHKNDIHVATENDAGCGFLESGRPSFDGIITQTKNLPLATFHADCVPIFLLDPVREVAGVVHAGWRGTALSTVGSAICKMRTVFGCEPEDILAAIGPCGGFCCYETDDDVPKAMYEQFGTDAKPYIVRRGEKWHVDLAGINQSILARNGILGQNITMSNICTCCQDDIYWSHRKTDGIRGCMAAIIMLS